MFWRLLTIKAGQSNALLYCLFSLPLIHVLLYSISKKCYPSAWCHMQKHDELISRRTWWVLHLVLGKWMVLPILFVLNSWHLCILHWFHSTPAGKVIQRKKAACEGFLLVLRYSCNQAAREGSRKSPNFSGWLQLLSTYILKIHGMLICMDTFIIRLLEAESSPSNLQ